MLTLPYAEALRALSKFAMIGKPGAARILLVAGVANDMALDSNGLRVLLRVGYGTDSGNYERSYRTVIDQISSQPEMSNAIAVEALPLLREHGREFAGDHRLLVTSARCEIVVTTTGDIEQSRQGSRARESKAREEQW